jgi:hypothetical protein
MPRVRSRATPSLAVWVAAKGVVVPNGMVITDDGSTLIVGESLASRYTAFTIGPDGELSDQRIWAEVTGQNGAGRDRAGEPRGGYQRDSTISPQCSVWVSQLPRISTIAAKSPHDFADSCQWLSIPAGDS